MKKIIVILLSTFLLVNLAACANTPSTAETSSSQAAVDVKAAEPTAEAVTENTTVETAAEANSTVTAISSPLVETGQGFCYNNVGEKIDCPAEGETFYGQDAQFTGNAFSYTDNGDGTVTDNVTSLLWQQTPDSNKYAWDDAQSYCENLSLAGSDDWRTPSLKELFSISDFEAGWPYIDTNYFGLITDSGQDKLEQYWSSNHYEVGTTHGGAASAIGVNHATGHIKAYPDGTDGSPMAGKYVRCVSGDDYLINEFADNGDGTTTDKATGLMWAQDDSGEALDWASSLAYANTANESNYLGYNDWRVPNVKELQSIVDYSGVYPAIDTSFFNITDIDSYFWTSTSAYFSPNNPAYYYAWYVAFGYAVDAEGNDSHGAGAVRFDTKAEGGPAGEDPERIYNYVRLVRGGDVTETPAGDPSADDSVAFVEGGSDGQNVQPNAGGPQGTGSEGGQPMMQEPDMASAAAALGVTEEALREALGDPNQGPPDLAAAAAVLGVTEEALSEALGSGAPGGNQQPPAKP